MKLSGASKCVSDLWRSGWDIHVNREKCYAYMTKNSLFRRIRYRDALKAMAARKAKERRPERLPEKQRIWTP